MNTNLICVIIVIIMVVAFYFYNKMQKAKDKAHNDAAWLLDYHNPASINYDSIRVAKEAADAAAALANDKRYPVK